MHTQTVTQADQDHVPLVFVMEMSEELDNKFVSLHLRPFFQAIFSDLSLRSTLSSTKSIDQATFV